MEKNNVNIYKKEIQLIKAKEDARKALEEQQLDQRTTNYNLLMNLVY